MPVKSQRFSYYKNLTKAQKNIYDKSDKIRFVNLPNAERFYPAVRALKKALEKEDREAISKSGGRIIYGLCHTFEIPQIRFKVLATRPSRDWGEMHGLYEWEEGEKPILTVWMRTAKQKNVVAFKTFLRTIVHEFLHHLDFTYLRLKDSFHTKGFYSRESSLAKQLMKETED